MVGEQGVVVDWGDGSGRVFVHGEYWNARSAGKLAANDRIEVVQMLDGLVLNVRPLDSDQPKDF